MLYRDSCSLPVLVFAFPLYPLIPFAFSGVFPLLKLCNLKFAICTLPLSVLRTQSFRELLLDPIQAHLNLLLAIHIAENPLAASQLLISHY